MKFIRINIFGVILCSALSVCAISTNDGPDFIELRDLIRAHLPGATDGELNRAAVEGLLSGLQGRVVLAGSEPTPGIETNAVAITKREVLTDGVAYLRVGRVAGGLAKELSLALQQLSAGNKLKGLVLDLRFTGGDDYAAAAGTAEMFQTKASRLLDWGDGMVEAKPTKDAIQFPVAVLVNGQTAGAAEALAAVLRKTGAGLVLGSKTAGRAAILQPFSLKSGQRVLIAVAAVKLGDGSVLSPDGYRPDISVVVKAEDERTYYADAFADPAKTNSTDSASMVITNQVAGTNRPARKRMSEAQLVREHRDGKGESEDAQSSPEPEADKPVLRDPALLRAVDLLKGLAVVRQSRAE